MKKEELAQFIDECLIDAWIKYQNSKGITSGDISPEDSLSWDELMGQVADFIIKVSKNNLPTFLDDEEKMADFERLSKEEFLSMYSYLSEEEYDHTKEMQEFFSDSVSEDATPVVAISGKGQYYALTASMLFEKTVLVPVDKATDIDEAMEMVDNAVELCEIELLDQDADYRITRSSFANKDGLYELSDEDAALYQIIGAKARDTHAETLKDIMKDVLETRGYEVTPQRLDELYDIYEECQDWADDEMLTGHSYDEVEDFVKHSSCVDEVMKKYGYHEGCSYAQCLAAEHSGCKTCWTGEIAREKGKDAYEEHIKMIADSTVVPEYDFEEICPHCDHVNKVKWNKKSHSIVCENCGKRILLCNLCDTDTVICGKCPYESEIEPHQGMRKMSWEEVEEKGKNKELAGYFYLYDDDTEGEIPQDYTMDEIYRHHNCGGEFGEEVNDKRDATKESYKGYELKFYPKCEEYPSHDNRYQTFKARPYDEADYYWAYTYDKESWIISYKGTVVIENFVGTFENVVDFIEEKNQNIKPKISHM